MPAFSVSAYPKRWHSFHDSSISSAGPVRTTDATQSHGYYVNAGSGACGGIACPGDFFTQSIFIAAGTYTLAILGETRSTCGILDVYVDNVFQYGSQDWYSAGTTNNVVKTGTIVVVGDGYHVIKFLNNGKNVSSTDWGMLFTYFQIYPSAD